MPDRVAGVELMDLTSAVGTAVPKIVSRPCPICRGVAIAAVARIWGGLWHDKMESDRESGALWECRVDLSWVNAPGIDQCRVE